VTTTASYADSVVCLAPQDTTGYLVTEVELQWSKFSVEVKCATGYTGTAKADVCENSKEEAPTAYTLSGCSK